MGFGNTQPCNDCHIITDGGILRACHIPQKGLIVNEHETLPYPEELHVLKCCWQARGGREGQTIFMVLERAYKFITDGFGCFPHN